MSRTTFSFLLLTVAALLSASDAFAPTSAISRQSAAAVTASATSLMAVVDIDGEAAFDKTVQNAGDSLVVVDYSTTW